MYKLVLLFKRRDEMSRQAFLDYWQDVHVPIVLKIPNIRRYVISPFDGSPSGQDDFDGMAELWFDDRESCEAALDTPETNASGIDGRNFIKKGTLRRFFCTEKVLVG